MATKKAVKKVKKARKTKAKTVPAKESENGSGIISLFIWVVGVIVALAVGSGMIDETLTVPAIPAVVTIIAGWVVVIGAILGVVLTIFQK